LAGGIFWSPLLPLSTRVAIAMSSTSDSFGAELEHALDSGAVQSLSTAEPAFTRPCNAASKLLQLPDELLVNICRSLSAADLLSCSLSCVGLRLAANDPQHWRRLHRLRWPAAEAADASERRSWKALYLARDADELATSRESSGDFAFVFVQALLAKRAEPAGPDAEPAATPTQPSRERHSVAIAAFRASRRLGNGRAHACSHERCAFAFLLAGEVAICRLSGRAHICDEHCLDARREGGEVTEVCSLTGRVRSTGYDVVEEEDDGCVVDDEEARGAGGALGRAYARGYEAASERELEDATWAIAGVARPRRAAVGRGRREE